MFCVLTGGWGIIQFEKFRTDEKDMTKVCLHIHVTKGVNVSV